MRLLDLFCKAGGCSVGYYRAGFEVEGVDIEPQPNYPFKFYRMDALEFLTTMDLTGYDAIHASPPCQKYTRLRAMHKDKEYPDLIEPIRELLEEIGRPYVIENVEGAPLNNRIMLCGSMFGLKVYRHRFFESNMFIWQIEHYPHNDCTPSVGRGISPKGFISVTGEGGFGIKDGFKYACDAMGIHWMSRKELSQAIPPAYTEWIGSLLIQQLKTTA